MYIVPQDVPQDILHEEARADWYATAYDRKFVVLEVYDGPINGYFYVRWGAEVDGHEATAPTYVTCQCDPCVGRCREDEVPEAELLAGAPDHLAAYKQSELYVQRMDEMRLEAIYN